MTRQEILAIAKPILFNTEMVRAILEGRKTVTRRVVKRKYSNTDLVMFTNKYGTRLIERQNDAPTPVEIIGEDGIKRTRHSLVACMECKPAYKVDDLLYVRETWCKLARVDENGYTHYDDCSYYYATDGDYQIDLYDDNGFLLDDQRMKWHPSIHMPKEAARIFLRVTDAKAERLQEITEEQAKAEGCITFSDKAGDGKFDDVLEFDLTARDAFIELWNGTLKKDAVCTWAANPWVWVYSFERVEAQS